MTKRNRFRTRGGPDFEAIREVTNLGLQERATELGGAVRIGEVEGFELMPPERGYTARGKAGITRSGSPLGSGTLYTVLFTPGQGTGDRTNYHLLDHPARWTPRRKDGYAELFMAIGTGYRSKWFPGVNSLSVVDHTGTHKNSPWIKRLTVGPRDYVEALRNGGRLERVSRFDFTLDRGAETPYGDPHAIIFDPSRPLDELDTKELFQVGAFLSFPQDDEGLTFVRDAIRKTA
ncbi:MAG: hypothetical protein ABH864_06240 [archaeon]